jgi:hypothetical protein
MSRAIACAALPALLSVLAHRTPTLTAVCEEPSGNRVDLVDQTIRRGDDSFGGVNPVFIIDDAKPGVLTVVWGPTKAVQDAGVPTSAIEAQIISQIDTKITAVRIDDAEYGVVHMYSLFPEKGLVFFTQHRYLNAAGGVPTASTFYAKCRFSRTG